LIQFCNDELTSTRIIKSYFPIFCFNGKYLAVWTKKKKRKRWGKGWGHAHVCLIAMILYWLQLYSRHSSSSSSNNPKFSFLSIFIPTTNYFNSPYLIQIMFFYIYQLHIYHTQLCVHTHLLYMAVLFFLSPHQRQLFCLFFQNVIN
jgi:hypothetical protein